ncbi:MAG TPA: glycosyltransferase family 4 protein, partial [Bacteroidales bacterium]|nr:glycosyltransferase family 4 protein [Bacteroidales bacterium]
LRDSVFILISKLFRRKVLCHLHGGYFRTWYRSVSPLLRKYVHWVHSKVDGQIVLGENLTDLYDDILDRRKIFVVPNGGNYDFKGVSRDPGKIRVLYLSNLIRTKGVMDVVHSLDYLKTDFSRLEFLFAGAFHEDEVGQEFRAFLDSTSFPVQYLGVVTGPAKTELLQRTDIFVFPTYYPNEGHPYAIVEALAAGLPVISTRHAAIPESVIHGVNGFLVDIKSPEQIAEKIGYLVENPDIRTKMAQESRRLYEEKFTEEKMIEKLIGVIDAVAGTS